VHRLLLKVFCKYKQAEFIYKPNEYLLLYFNQRDPVNKTNSR